MRFEAWDGWAECHPWRQLNVRDGWHWTWILGLFAGGWDRLLAWLLEGVMRWCLAGWSPLLACFVFEGVAPGGGRGHREVDRGEGGV